MVGEWKSTRELPSRFLLGVQDDLKKIPNGALTIVQALYHTVATGHVLPPVKEWLVDTLAERVRRPSPLDRMSPADGLAGT
jgi:anaphase-promoting complex subunit 4